VSFADLVRLRSVLAAEPLPEDAETIVALRLPGTERYHLGRTQNGELCALIETQVTSHGTDVRLRNLEARQGVRCRVRDPDGREFALVGSLVVCCTNQPTLVDLFLRLYADAAEDLGPVPSAAAVAGWLQALATLLSRLELESRRTLQGLWAELFVIRELGDAPQLLRRWHADPRERFDFLGSGFALEVKSCQEFDRVHEFSLDQLRPPDGLEAWVASIVVRRDVAGVSVLELAAHIESEIGDRAQRMVFRDMVLTSGGAAIEDDDHHRFDLTTARTSLRLLDALAIPCLRETIPPEVLSVTLRVRCEAVAEAGTRAGALQRLRA
jgi:hypothetical protein